LKISTRLRLSPNPMKFGTLDAKQNPLIMK
jgi:hypothetical protein